MALSKRKISKIWSPLKKVLLKEHNHSLLKIKKGNLGMYWLIRLRQISCQRCLLDAFISILVKAKIKLKFKITKGTTVIRVMIGWGIIMILNQVILCFDHVLYDDSPHHSSSSLPNQPVVLF